MVKSAKKGSSSISMGQFAIQCHEKGMTYQETKTEMLAKFKTSTK
jgi:hypothetical protein